MEISRIKEWIEEHKLFGSQKCVKCGIRDPSRCPLEFIQVQKGLLHQIESCGGLCGHVTKDQQYKQTNKQELQSIHQICYMCTVGSDEDTYLKNIYKGVETKKKENTRGGFIIHIGTKEYIESLDL